MAKEVFVFFLLLVSCVTNAMQFQRNQIVRPFLVDRRMINAPTNSQQAAGIEDISKLGGLEQKENNQPKRILPENFFNAEDGEVNSKYWKENFEQLAAESDEEVPAWEPILDGKVLEVVGGFFSDEIKDEANRDREEREKLREKQLYEKYRSVLNNPAKFRELQEESKNSPKYINQVVRRSFVPSWQTQGQSNGRYMLR